MQIDTNTRFSYRNDSHEAQVVCVEPWGCDYTLLPAQHLKVQDSEGQVFRFTVEHSPGGFQLWCETSEVDVFVDGAPVECGHNRGLK